MDRFPRLWLPFAVVGACAGWLCAGFLSHDKLWLFPPSLRLHASVTATVFAAVAGAAMRRACVRRRYRYELPDAPITTPSTDVWWFHAAAMITAGALTPVVIGVFSDAMIPRVGLCLLSGSLCAVAFFPVGFSVLGAARRAQRARSGSIVARSDRRAVWSTLAATIGAMTWIAFLDELYARVPWPALGMLACSTIVVVGVLVADARARRALEDAIRDLEPSPRAASAPVVDLGVGDAVGARVARSGPAYRSAEITSALVVGDPDEARAALAWAVRRGRACLAALAAMGCVHGVFLTCGCAHP